MFESLGLSASFDKGNAIKKKGEKDKAYQNRAYLKKRKFKEIVKYVDTWNLSDARGDLQ